jgi:peptidoglycan hydrolase CwlO-like protein
MADPLEDVAEFLETAASHVRVAITARDHREINDRLNDEIQTKEKRLAELTKTIDDVEGAHSKRVREMDAQIAARQQRISDLDVEVTKRQDLKSQIQNYIDSHLPPLKEGA